MRLNWLLKLIVIAAAMFMTFDCDIARADEGRKIHAGETQVTAEDTMPAPTPDRASETISASVIQWQVISAGGSDGNSASYTLNGTAGQVSIGTGSSASFALSGGYWQDFEGSSAACVPGDADGSSGVDIDDVVYLIAYIFTGGPPPAPEVCCGDADGSSAVDIDDVVYLIGYIFVGGNAPVDAC